jgi:DNA-binding GntR family transcriptional regulator
MSTIDLKLDSIPAPPDTLSERAAQALHRGILGGALTPGARLGIAELVKQYGIGATPMREGLSRLVARGLVVAVGNRGFRVARTSREDLEDIVRTRSLVEVEALRMAMRHGDDEWEAQIVACLHRLGRAADSRRSNLLEDAAEFDLVHKAFHTALIAACGSPRLLEYHSQLYDQTYRYRRVMLARVESVTAFKKEHQEIVALVLRRDAEAACGRLRRHIGITLALVFRDRPKPARRR